MGVSLSEMLSCFHYLCCIYAVSIFFQEGRWILWSNTFIIKSLIKMWFAGLLYFLSSSSAQVNTGLHFLLRMRGWLGLKISTWKRSSFQPPGGFRLRKPVWKCPEWWQAEREGRGRQGIGWPLLTSTAGLDGSGAEDDITNTNLALSGCRLPGPLELDLSEGLFFFFLFVLSYLHFVIRPLPIFYCISLSFLFCSVKWKINTM